MIFKSKYNKQFVSNFLTKMKYEELYAFAMYLRKYKNILSKKICDNILLYLDMNKFEFLKYIRNNFPIKINSNFDSHAIIDVFISYQNKFNALQKTLTFYNVEFKGFDFYKRNCKNHKKGDFKKVNNKKTKSPLTTTLTYLARYGNDNTVEYIIKQLTNSDLNTKQRDYYSNILNHVNKFGFERLLLLSLQKRERIIKRYSSKPIEFKSLTFRGRSRKRKIIDYNKSYKSTINAFISLSWESRKSLDIPIKFAKNYHGSMKDYYKDNNPNYEYVVLFDEKHKQVRINICKDGERYAPSVTNEDKLVGIDVNVKHNLFSLSNGETYDYDRNLVNDFCNLSMEIDKLKSKNKDYKIGKRKQFKLDALRLKIKKKNQELISSMCKTLQVQGVRHIVMEDLNNGFGKSFVKDKNNGDINFNRVVKFLNISSLKDEVEHIARNYDIALSTVHSCYTSKMCSICGCIEDENRLNQEEFSCIECGYPDNADHNASINIKNRVGEAVLRSKLLKQVDNGSFLPKKLERDKVKEILLSFRRSHICGSESILNVC